MVGQIDNFTALAAKLQGVYLYLILAVPCADLPQQSCHCCTTAEPSEEEFTAAKGEALQGLQVAIDNINDVLEELKYAEAEYNE